MVQTYISELFGSLCKIVCQWKDIDEIVFVDVDKQIMHQHIEHKK